jgi:hypothetical protein
MLKNAIAAISFVFFGSVAAHASPFNVFPTASDIVGMTLPEAHLEYENKRFAKEILRRFDFDNTVLSLAEGEMFAGLLRFRKNSCGGKFATESDFIIGRSFFSQDIKRVLAESNLIIRARQWLMYRANPTEQTYAEIKAVPVSPLTKMFVADWQIRSYLESEKTKTALENLTNEVWKMNCPK